MDEMEVELAGGLWDDAGRLHRAALLRPLTGREEEVLAADPRRAPAEAVTDLLARCVLRVGAVEPVDAERVRELLVGDRDLLLLNLRRLTFGDQVWADLVCPWEDCGERVSISFALSDVPCSQPPERAPQYVVRLRDHVRGGAEPVAREPEAGGREIVFRLPTGGDQEALSALAAVNEAAALTELLARCVLAIDGDPATYELVEALRPLERAAIESEMERLAPAVERALETRCAECGRGVVAPFDLHRCFFGELRTDRELLYREVHQLAFHYHWSEPDIMAMPRTKRHAYLDVLAEEIERLNSGV